MIYALWTILHPDMGQLLMPQLDTLSCTSSLDKSFELSVTLAHGLRSLNIDIFDCFTEMQTSNLMSLLRSQSRVEELCFCGSICPDMEELPLSEIIDTLPNLRILSLPSCVPVPHRHASCLAKGANLEILQVRLIRDHLDSDAALFGLARASRLETLDLVMYAGPTQQSLSACFGSLKVLPTSIQNLFIHEEQHKGHFSTSFFNRDFVKHLLQLSGLQNVIISLTAVCQLDNRSLEEIAYALPALRCFQMSMYGMHGPLRCPMTLDGLAALPRACSNLQHAEVSIRREGCCTMRIDKTTVVGRGLISRLELTFHGKWGPTQTDGLRRLIGSAYEDLEEVRLCGSIQFEEEQSDDGTGGVTDMIASQLRLPRSIPVRYQQT
ncbi:hypothetical protein OE88DRAFT_525142 [Heliocybe sulcata]|uniref:RNI-like protein n=1 Tax=Heliocybe sulcata TaxID=5364 RepID=A0A5C3MU08_9AGAM|nr:hypothetical protein OE88DRAFT_525142 [Heliocybe sulcata]